MFKEKSRNCTQRIRCELMDQNNEQCKFFHHKLLNEYNQEDRVISHTNGRSESGSSPALLMISEVVCYGFKVAPLWDPGSIVSLISRYLAQLYGLQGKPCRLSVTKAGNQTDVTQSMEYQIPLRLKEKEVLWITCYEIEDITAEVKKADFRRVGEIFRGVTEEDVRRPIGKVNLLIGTDNCSILPDKVRESGNLQLMKNQFGYCLRGSHPKLGACDESFKCNLFHAGNVLHDMHNNNGDLVQAETNNNLTQIIENFVNRESAGVEYQCTKCGLEENTSGFSPEQQRELDIIEKGLTFDAENHKWTATYPWLVNPKTIRNNCKAARARLESLEKRLLKKGEKYAAEYEENFQDMIRRGVVRRLTEEEIRKYEGPVFYLPHFEVVQPHKTTKMRIVFNSSAVHFQVKLNDCWLKGPAIMNDMLDSILKFRKNYIGVTGDLSKMYNSVLLGEIDQHMHRVLWRHLETDRNPSHYILQTLPFGDRPSGTFATLALRKTANMFKEIYPETVDALHKDIYVDDILKSVDTLQESHEFMKQTEEITEYGGFKIKQWVVSDSKELSESSS